MVVAHHDAHHDFALPLSAIMQALDFALTLPLLTSSGVRVMPALRGSVNKHFCCSWSRTRPGCLSTRSELQLLLSIPFFPFF